MSDHTKVGELRSGNEPRDAIHIAVAPVIAATHLDPGQTIGFIYRDNTEEVGPCEHAMSVGIVDPFLMKRVHPGDRIWMFLHPNTITSLRHNWTHPAFGSVNEDNHQDEASSEKWLRDFLSTEGPSYEDLIEAVNNGGQTGNGGYNYVRIEHDYLSVGGTDAHGDIPPEFWDHVETVVGRKLSVRPDRFSCSC